MAHRLVRSPQYFSRSTSNSSVNSSTFEIKVNNVVLYDLIKSASPNVYCTFEWAELVRDYIDVELGSSSFPPTQNAVDVDLTQKFWSGTNGTGSLLATNTESHYAFDGYGDFYEGSNPDIPNSAAFPAINNYTQAGTSSSGTKTYTIYAGKNTTIRVPQVNTNGTITYISSGYNSTSMTVGGETINIERKDCTKYTASSTGYWNAISITGFVVWFVNKYGAIQQEVFNLKSVQDIKAKRQQYNNNIIDSQGVYDVNKHTKQNFNIIGNQSIKLNSFYVPEYYSKVYEEMLLSEKIWIRLRIPSTGNFQNVPINIKTSRFNYKTNLNEKLIQYEFNFDMSFDFINNVR